MTDSWSLRSAVKDFTALPGLTDTAAFFFHPDFTVGPGI